MHRYRRSLVRNIIAITVGLLLLVFSLSSALAQSPSPSPTATIPSATPALSPTPSPISTPSQAVPPEVSQYSQDWPLPNRDYSNTRATTDSGINSRNINTLNLAWSYQLSGGASANPLIINKTVYFQDLNSNVVALDLATGQVKWKKDYNLPNLGPNGPAVGYSKVFVCAGTSNVAALDINTGNELWSVKVSPKDTIGLDIQPMVYDNMVYVSTTAGGTKAGNVGGNIGTIYALDQGTGQVKWSFDTVDSKDIWGNPQVNSGGGCYFPPAIDVTTGLIYWGTANPAPYPGTDQYPNGFSRPGPNLYTNSLLALDHSTGNLKWFNQVYPHDLFNYSLAISPLLTSATINSIQRNIVLGTGKTGKVYAFNRQNGGLLWETSVGTHMNDMLDQLPSGTTRVSPAELGGVESCMAYSDGIIYVAVDDMYADFTSSSFKPQDIATATGEFVAIQANTGKIQWDKSFPSLDIGAATVVNDVVFTGTLDGNLYGLNRTTGDQVWKYQSAPGINGWAAVSGDTIVFLGGINKNPALLAFRLGAPPPASATASPSATVAPSLAPTASPALSPTPSSSAATPPVSPSVSATPSSLDLTNQNAPQAAVFQNGKSVTQFTPAPNFNPNIGLQLVTQNLVGPTEAAWPDDGTGKVFIADQPGSIRIVDSSGNLLDTPLLDLSGKIVPLNSGYDERGLLGMDTHPSFKDNGRIFVFYTSPLRQGAPSGWDHTCRISEFKVTGDTADINSEKVLLEFDMQYTGPDGGQLHFGPDGYLYISVGDGKSEGKTASGQNPNPPLVGTGQDLTNFFGKILRIDVDKTSGGKTYAIPADNPFAGQSNALPEIYAYGFRDPYDFSFDSGGNHGLFDGNSGQALFESVDLVVKGGNYGWSLREGTHPFNPNNQASPSSSGPTTGANGEPLIGPIIEIGHDVGQSLIGGYVYRGSALTNFKGRYVFGDWNFSQDLNSGALMVSTPPQGWSGNVPASSKDLKGSDIRMWTTQKIQVPSTETIKAFVRGFAEDNSQELYILTSNNAGPSGTTGKMYKIVPAATSTASPSATPSPSLAPTASPTLAPTSSPALSPTHSSSPAAPTSAK